MEENKPKDYNDKIFSKAVKSGKRTYFFDVKSTSNNSLYITITESKKRFNAATGQFTYDKHKIFLYPEDFASFANGLSDAMEFIETGALPSVTSEVELDEMQENISFEDLAVN